MSILDNSWKYIGEGNAHIVLEILDTAFVLRLIKDNEKTVDLSTVQRSVDFVNNVMLPLLYNHNVEPCEIITLEEHEAIKLSEDLLPMRPEHRTIKSVVSNFAIKAPNLSIVSPKFAINYCLEIKPKEGFMSANLRRYSKCYYCLKQFLKLQKKQINSVSQYCPLDLFSGDVMRMRKALMNLINNPQNNLRVFRNGTLVYYEKSPRRDFDSILEEITVFQGKFNLFLDSIAAILLSSPGKSTCIPSESSNFIIRNQNDCCVDGNDLRPNNFLYNLLSIQKLSEISTNTKEIPYEGTEYVSSILQLIENHKIDLKDEADRQKFYSLCDPQHLALIAAVSRDCSLMISFSEHYDVGLPHVEIEGKKLSYKLAVTDLEPKSAGTLLKRKETENKLTEIYKKYTELSDMDENESKIQPHSETRTKQLEAWQQLIADYLKATKQSTIDIRESQNCPLFNNASINRKLSQEAILIILEHMSKTGRAAAVDKSRNVWEVYWHSLDEWGNMIYNWASSSGLNNAVCTLFEIREGENTVDEEFHGLDVNILIKALKQLQTKGKCELMEFDDNQGVKFF